MENKTPAPFEESNSLAQALLLIGMSFMGFCLFMAVLTVLQVMGLIDMAKFSDAASYADKNVVSNMRNVMLLQDLMIFIIPAAVFSFLVSRNRVQYLQMNRIGNPRFLFLGILTMLASIPLINFLGELNHMLPLPEFLQRMEQDGNAIEAAFEQQHTVYDLIYNLFVMALFAGFSEELFFRAGLQKVLIKMAKNIHTGIWITAAIFSAIHFQFYGFIPRMLLGVFLGYLYVWSGSLWVGIFAHFMFNGSQILAAYLQPGKDSSTGVFSETPGYAFITLSTLLVIALLIRAYKVSQKKDNDVIVTSE